MKYLGGSFSVFPGGSSKYRSNYDDIDWSDGKDKQQEVLDECPVCGAKSTVKVRMAPFGLRLSLYELNGKYNQMAVHLDAESCVCESCGEEFYTKAQSEEVAQGVKAAARKHTPE